MVVSMIASNEHAAKARVNARVFMRARGAGIMAQITPGETGRGRCAVQLQVYAQQNG